MTEKPRERGPGHGGVDAILFRAAQDLQLTDAQKAQVAALEGRLHDRETGPRDAMKAFSSDLAAQVRAGKIEATKLQPDETAVDAALKAMLEKQATALAGLHALLDANQRKALTDAVRARWAAREASARSRDGGADDWAARRLDRMTNDLGLDAGQQKQVAALLAKQPARSAMRADMSKHLAALLAAFEVDPFDASQALQPTLKGPHDAMDRQIAFTAQVLPVLRADQREKFAASTSRPHGRGGPGEEWSEDEDTHGSGDGRGE